MGSTQGIKAAIEFQSSPTPKGGRYIRLTRQGRELNWFQSSPTPKGGRYTEQLFLPVRLSAFQSSPTPKGGRYVKSKRIAITR